MSWYYSLQDPVAPAEKQQPPAPVHVGITFTGSALRSDADFVRSLVNGGVAVGVMLTPKRLSEQMDNSTLTQYGDSKCAGGKHSGRWVAVDAGKPCEPFQCSGSIPKATNGGQQQWLWVPYDCYFHIYDASAAAECATAQDMTWLHTMGDLQLTGLMEHLLSFGAPDSKFDTAFWPISYTEVRVL